MLTYQIRVGHSVLGIPFSYYCSADPPVPSGDAQIPSVLVIPSKKILDFAGTFENVLEMDSAKYRRLFQYLKLEMNEAGVAAGYF